MSQRLPAVERCCQRVLMAHRTIDLAMARPARSAIGIRHCHSLFSTMSTLQSTVKLNTGAHMPVISLGTWKSAPGQVEHAVEFSLKSAGYKGIDTAAE